MKHEKFIEYTSVTGKKIKVPARYADVKGHASVPGSGPKGETCKTCAFLTYHTTGTGRRFYKCNLVNWTLGAATDIRLKDFSCLHWSKLK